MESSQYSLPILQGSSQRDERTWHQRTKGEAMQWARVNQHHGQRHTGREGWAPHGLDPSPAVSVTPNGPQGGTEWKCWRVSGPGQHRGNAHKDACRHRSLGRGSGRNSRHTSRALDTERETYGSKNLTSNAASSEF